MAELDRAAVSSRIGVARKQSGLTQHEFADVMSVHFRTVQNWESLRDDRVPWDRLDEIARVTNVTRDWLLHGDQEPAGGAVDGERLDRLERHIQELLRRHHEDQAALSRLQSSLDELLRRAPGA